jgi:hypothetical protein
MSSHISDEDMNWLESKNVVETGPDVKRQLLSADETIISPILLFVLSGAAGFAFVYAAAGWLF